VTKERSLTTSPIKDPRTVTSIVVMFFCEKYGEIFWIVCFPTFCGRQLPAKIAVCWLPNATTIALSDGHQQLTSFRQKKVDAGGFEQLTNALHAKNLQLGQNKRYWQNFKILLLKFVYLLFLSEKMRGKE